MIAVNSAVPPKNPKIHHASLLKQPPVTPPFHTSVLREVCCALQSGLTSVPPPQHRFSSLAQHVDLLVFHRLSPWFCGHGTAFRRLSPPFTAFLWIGRSSAGVGVGLGGAGGVVAWPLNGDIGCMASPSSVTNSSAARSCAGWSTFPAAPPDRSRSTAECTAAMPTSGTKR